MHRAKALPLSACSAMLPTLQSLRYAQVCRIRLQQSYATCAAYCIRPTQISNWGTGSHLPSKSQDLHLQDPTRNCWTVPVVHSAISTGRMSGQFLAPRPLLNQAPHRNFSSFSDLVKQMVTVKAEEPILPVADATAAATPLSAPTTTSNLTEGVEYIPVPPPILEGGVDPSILNALGEPTLASLGLAGWSPVGLMQSALEALHVNLDIPWWGSIALATLMVRLALFPVVVIAQRSSANLANHGPQMQVLQMKVSDARNSGDHMEVSRYTHELMKYMNEKNLKPLRSMLVPLVQAPVFISMFVGLRRCANLPVLSMTTGGMYWFTDLTVADPYYLLPVLTCCTMYLTIHLGTEVGRASAVGENAQLMFKFLKLTPLITFPFMINFPGAVLCYWLTTNLVSLGQAGLLRIPRVRNYFNIPILIKHNPNSLPITKKGGSKGIVESAKDSWRNMKVTREIEDRRRYDEVRFAKAGTGPLIRTFKYDPTKTRKASSPIINVKAKVKQG